MLLSLNKNAQPRCATLTQGALRALGRGEAKSTASFIKKSGVFAIALVSGLFTNTQVNAATPDNTLVNNTAYVSYQFRGNDYQKQDSESFITARSDSGAGTPSVITLMHNSIDFSAQYAAAKAKEDAANPPSSNVTRSISQNLLTTGATTGKSSNATTTRASSNGKSLSGNFVVNQGQCASDASGKTLTIQPVPKNYQGQTLSLPSTLALNSDDYYKVGDTIFVHLKDLDQNQDPTQIEKIIVTILSENGVDQETIQLTETAVSSGLFTGYIQTVNSATNAPIKHNCALSVTSDSSIQASYQDKFDSLDLAKAGALFDPSSYVVNADTGEYVNGITVSLYDKDGVTPAEILSDEGGVFPNTVTTGGTVSVVGADSNTYTYTFPYGGFAFPVLDGGEYVIKIGESAYHDYPVADEKPLTDIPQGPFNFDEEGSRGKIFTSGITFRMDVPLDPKDNSVLLTKTANKAQAGVGELVSYNIKLQNTEIPGTNVALKDTLPQGFRYAPGSASIDGVKIADPTISRDGQDLTFTFANIAVDEVLNLRYVARIGVATPVGKATNTVWIEDQEDIPNEGILTSNTAIADIEITEDLFSNNTRLFGRVYIGDCQGNVQQEGIAGARIYLENGTYVVTDEDGLWHIEGQEPGTHVVQLDTETLPKYLDLMACDNFGQHAGREYSQFVDLAPGSMWRTDFIVKLKPPSKGEVTQRLSSRLAPITQSERETLAANSPVEQKIVYRLLLNGSEVILKDLRSLLMLPEGVMYKPNSALLDGVSIDEPKKYDEQTLLFSLNDPGKDWQHVLEFEAYIGEDAKPGELTTRSVAMFNSPSQNNQRTPIALTSALLALVPANNQVHKPKEAPKFGSFSEELSAADKQAMAVVIKKLKGLKDLQIEVAGHTDNVPIARRSRHIFKDNYELSLARARSAANYLMQELTLAPDQVSIAGFGANKPISKNSNESLRSQNRRVEVNILSANNGMRIAKADSGNQMVATTGVAPGGFDFPIEATASGPIRNTVTMPEFDKAYLAQTNNTFEWLWPSEGFLPNIPSTKVAIKHPMNQRIRLTLNGSPVSELNFAKREKYAANQSAVSQWSGVDIKEGNNVFVASLVDDNNDIIDRKEFQLHYAGSPTRVELVKDETKAVADGVIAPVIAVQLFDKDGYPVRNGLQGEYTIDSPYKALDPNKDRAQINRNEFKPNYEITDDGIAYITLEPTTQAGEALIRFPLANGQEEEIRVWLKPQARDWMLIALGEGTIGYQNIRGNIKNAESHDQEDGFYTDGRLALFAKGQIAGDWLLTAAYDSSKETTTPFEKLLDPNKYYTLYGDNSTQKLDASMEGKLYLRIEKERFYTVFGDYSTDLNKTELSTYLRKFHGIQSVFQGDIVSFNAFVTESAQRFARDEIRGDGTSGLYSLSNSDIISNSETISLQVRDRFRSEVILSEVELTKDSDYSIDYIDGSIFFKSPVQSTDEDLNPRYIIARYETQDDSANDLTFGGRAAVHVLDKAVEVGTTLISEELGEDSKTLNSVDMRLQLSDQLEIKAETAITEQKNNGTKTSATANYVSLDFRGEQLQTKAYIRTEEAGFGLDQLNDSEGSTEKLGVEGTYYITSQQYFNALVSDQNQLGNEQRLSMAELTFNNEYELGRYRLGGRVSENTSAVGDTQSIQQLLAGHSYTLMNGRWLLNADLEFNLKQNDDIYDLLRLGSDFRINDQVTLFAVHEMGFERDAPTRSVAGIRATPWQGMQVSNSVEQQQSKDGNRLFAVHGVNQEVNLDENWQISFGYDQSQNLENSVLEQPDDTAINFAQTSDDFYAINTGWGYRSPTWQWTNRIEYRESDTNEKWNATSGIYRPIGLGFAFGLNGEYRLDDGDNERTEFKQVEFDIGLRPLAVGLAWLNQTKYIEEEISNASNTIAADLVSRRLVNNTHINMRWTKTQLSAQYGFKYVDETLDDIAYSGVIDLMGAQVRRHFMPKWDWGLQAQRLYDYELKDSRHSAGISLGYIPKQNTWVSVGYNFAGFTDSDFDDAGYSAQGIYLKLRIKADQDNLRALKAYFN
ncbi:MAG: OmpA family protein [Bermanella sp.]